MNILRKKNKKTILMIGVATLILFLLSLGTGYNLTFFNSDTGLRFLQIEHLIRQEWRTFAIDYPARFADPTLQHVPYYYAYSVIDDNIYLNISPFLPLLASFLYYSLGPAGLSLLPILGSVLTGLAIYRLVQLADLPYSQIAFGATIFATPLLFYSLTLWDHTLGTALATWAVYWLVKGLQQKQWQALWLGGIAMGLALGQRPELYVFAIALGLSLLLVVKLDWATLFTFGSGGLGGVLPILQLQYMLVGHPLGMATAPHLLGYGKPEAYAFSPDFIGSSGICVELDKTANDNDNTPLNPRTFGELRREVPS